MGNLTNITQDEKSPSILKAFKTLGEEAMISHEVIATLAGARNDKVKQSLERLKNKGILTFTPMGETSSQNKKITVYYVNKRNSLVAIAQIKPEVTAELVDRWDELEKEQSKAYKIPENFSEALLLASKLAKGTDNLKEQIKQDASKVAFHDTVTASNTVCQMAVACQVAKLPFGRNILYKKLREKGVLISGGDRNNLPKQLYILRGLFTVEENTYKHPKTGEPIVTFTTHVTQKGIDWLIKRFGTKEAKV